MRKLSLLQTKKGWERWCFSPLRSPSRLLLRQRGAAVCVCVLGIPAQTHEIYRSEAEEKGQSSCQLASCDHLRAFSLSSAPLAETFTIKKEKKKKIQLENVWLFPRGFETHLSSEVASLNPVFNPGPKCNSPCYDKHSPMTFINMIIFYRARICFTLQTILKA